MSVQFGKWNFAREPLAIGYLDHVRTLLAPYGPDGERSYSDANVHILYHGFHTTQESLRETQPYTSKSGLVITWDGRLDNRVELLPELKDLQSPNATDVCIVAAILDRFGKKGLAELIGDWAISVWDPREQTLLLATDFLGSRHLYYSLDESQITWSTLLDPLVLCGEKSFVLDEEFVAGWLAFFPAAHLTPYVGIRAVPPSSYILVKNRKVTAGVYWEFDPDKRICYRHDNEYEDHFRIVFAQSVRRRLRSHAPVLAELSGGVDSSSIVCVADLILAQGQTEAPQLDTVSYYDDREPNWNERPYFTRVEEKRGRTGCHIDVGDRYPLTFAFNDERFVSTPGAQRYVSRAGKEFTACMLAGGYRVLLSGIGGDEVTGGVPTPIPELADLLARARFQTLAHQLKVWALSRRTTWFHLFWETVRCFLPPLLFSVPEHMRPAPWLMTEFIQRNRSALNGYDTRRQIRGPLPSLQENLSTLSTLRREIACSSPSIEPLYEKRFPYLDRDLLEFLYAIPREQILRPHQRRSLMRRSLSGFLPDEIVNRKRKAFVSRGPLAAISADWHGVVSLTQQMVSNARGFVNQETFAEVLQQLRNGREFRVVAAMRTLALECWLRHASDWKVLELEDSKDNIETLKKKTRTTRPCRAAMTADP
jgi:asparagine synthase (glutamine-hydrolysing)